MIWLGFLPLISGVMEEPDLVWESQQSRKNDPLLLVGLFPSNPRMDSQDMRLIWRNCISALLGSSKWPQKQHFPQNDMDVLLFRKMDVSILMHLFRGDYKSHTEWREQGDIQTVHCVRASHVLLWQSFSSSCWWNLCPCAFLFSRHIILHPFHQRWLFSSQLSWWSASHLCLFDVWLLFFFSLFYFSIVDSIERQTERQREKRRSYIILW